MKGIHWVNNWGGNAKDDLRDGTVCEQPRRFNDTSFVIKSFGNIKSSKYIGDYGEDHLNSQEFAWTFAV